MMRRLIVSQRRSANRQPCRAVARRRTLLEDVSDQVHRVTDVDLTVAVGIAAAQRIRRRRRSLLEDVGNQVNRVTDVETTVAIRITGDAIARGLFLAVNLEGEID